MMGKNTIATNEKEEWMSKLLRKKITDSTSDNMVCGNPYYSRSQSRPACSWFASELCKEGSAKRA